MDLAIECVPTYGFSNRLCSYLWIFNVFLLMDLAIEYVLTYGLSSRMCSYLW